MSNPWTLHVGKLVVPDVFIELDLIRMLAKRYNLEMNIVRSAEGLIMADLQTSAKMPS